MSSLNDRATIAADLFGIGERLREIGDGERADAVERIAYDLGDVITFHCSCMKGGEDDALTIPRQEFAAWFDQHLDTIDHKGRTDE